MKKVLITLLIVLGAVSCAWAERNQKVDSLVKEYRGNDGFDVISMGPLSLSLIKVVVAVGGDLDQEDRVALAGLNGIRKITIVDFEGAAHAVKEQFCSRMETILKGMELILEAKDQGSTMRIYGIDDGKKIRDCILYSSDGALICTRGSIDLENLGQLMEMAE